MSSGRGGGAAPPQEHPQFPLQGWALQLAGSFPSMPHLGAFAAQPGRGLRDWERKGGRLQPPGLQIHRPPSQTCSHPGTSQGSLRADKYLTQQPPRVPGPGSHQHATPSCIQCMHTCTHTHTCTLTCTYTQATYMPASACEWTGRSWLSKPSWPGYLRPGSHGKVLLEPAGNISGSIQPSKGFFFQHKS